MSTVGIIFGSDTGATQDATEIIIGNLGTDAVEVIEVNRAEISDFQRFDLLLIGLSTWHDGELQSDWEFYFDTFQTIDFSGQIVALFGLGDQIGYSEYFIDGVGILAKVILENGGTIIGEWPIEGYDFTESKAQKNDEVFYGLALDEDNEPDMTAGRIEQWVEQIINEYNEYLVVSGS